MKVTWNESSKEQMTDYPVSERLKDNTYRNVHSILKVTNKERMRKKSLSVVPDYFLQQKEC